MIADSHYRRLLADRYQLLELIGTGSMGQVFKAEDKLLGGVTVAVKFLSQTLLSEKMKERFEREATISALLGEKSIHIVKVRVVADFKEGSFGQFVHFKTKFKIGGIVLIFRGFR